MRIYLIMFLLWMVHSSDGMDNIHQNIATDAVRFAKAAIVPPIIGNFLHTQYGGALTYPYPGVGVQLVQMGISLLFLEAKEWAVLYLNKNDLLHHGKVEQKIFDIYKRVHIAELCCTLLFYAALLAYHKNFTHSKHWVGVAQHLLITELFSLYALIPVSCRAKEEEDEFGAKNTL